MTFRVWRANSHPPPYAREKIGLERGRNSVVMKLLRDCHQRGHLALIVVDEAQKVLSYGGSFRPIFNFLGEIRKALPARLHPRENAAAGAGSGAGAGAGAGSSLYAPGGGGVGGGGLATASDAAVEPELPPLCAMTGSSLGGGEALLQLHEKLGMRGSLNVFEGSRRRPELRLEVHKCRPLDRRIFPPNVDQKSKYVVEERARNFMRKILDAARERLTGGALQEGLMRGGGGEEEEFPVTIIYCVRREVVKDVAMLVEAAYPSLANGGGRGKGGAGLDDAVGWHANTIFKDFQRLSKMHSKSSLDCTRG